MPNKKAERTGLQKLQDIFSRYHFDFSSSQCRFVSFLFCATQYKEKLEEDPGLEFLTFSDKGEGYISESTCSRILNYAYHDGFAVQTYFKRLWAKPRPQVQEAYAVILQKAGNIKGVAGVYQELSGHFIREETQSEVSSGEAALCKLLAGELLDRLSEISQTCFKLKHPTPFGSICCCPEAE